MNLTNKIAALKAIIKVKLFSKRIPFIISWHLVNRCNRRCKYCFRWDVPCKELTTQQVISIINDFEKIGTRVIIFSGGESLLRDDIGEIINYCRSKNIFTGLTSNGSLVSLKINEIKNLNILKLSLDGPKEINDFLRGDGSYDDVMTAVEFGKKHGLKIKFNTTLSKYNLSCIDFILQKAKELDIKVKFQPLSHIHTSGKNIDFLLPEEKDYKDAIKKLIYLKKSNKYIINSFSALGYLYNWPMHKKLNCYGGKIVCSISPDGNLYPCTMLMKTINAPNCLNISCKEAFDNLANSSCKGCWCTSTLDLNCLMTFKLNTILNIKKLFI